MNHRKMIASGIAILSVLILTIVILVIIHTIVADRLSRAENSVPEEAMLGMTDGVSLDPLENIESADGIVRKFAALDEKEEPVGYVFEAVSEGLDGDVRIRISFDEDYLIDQISVLETAGQPTNLGYKAASASYLRQYIGAASVTTDPGSVTGTLIRSAEGADYSCQGVYSCVQAAFQQLEVIRTAQTESGEVQDEN